MKKLISEHKGRIRSIIRKLTGSYNEDVEQEVYIKLWRNLEQYEEQGKLKQWISTMTANLCRDYFRSSQYKQSARAVSDDEVLAAVSQQATQENYLDEKKRQKVILQAVNDLPPKMKKVIVLYEFEGVNYDDIAKSLKVSVGTVKSRLFNARKLLAERLSFLQGEE